MRDAIYEAAALLPHLEGHLLEALDASQRVEAAQQAAALGLKGWAEWVDRNQPTVTLFLHSTAREMKKRKEFLPLQPLLTLAALQRLAAAKQMLRACLHENLCEPTHTGQSWLVSAGLAYATLVTEPILFELEHWPWDGPSPFASP